MPSVIKVISAPVNVDIPVTDNMDVTQMTAHLVNDTVLAGATVTVQAKAPDAPASAYVPIPYKRRNLLGAVSDDTVVSATLGVSFLIEVDSAGQDIRFAVTGGGITGSGTLYIYPRRG